MRSHADSDANDVFPRHQLGETQNVAILLLADPDALLDGYATRPNTTPLPGPHSATFRKAMNSASSETVGAKVCPLAIQTSVIGEAS